MTVLSNQEIHRRLGNTIHIQPFRQENVNTSSYDVTLGAYYYIEKRPGLIRRTFNPVYNIWDFEDVTRVWDGWYGARQLDWWHRHRPWRFRKRYKNIGRKDRVIFIPPMHTILAHTAEFIGGRGAISGELYPIPGALPPCTTMMKARSSMGRNFIEVCKCAGYGDVGYTNRWTMEITNNSRFYYVPLVVGRRIAQIVFMETGALLEGGDYTTSGKYQGTADTKTLLDNWSPVQMLPRLDQDRDVRDRAA